MLLGNNIFLISIIQGTFVLLGNKICLISIIQDTVALFLKIIAKT